MSTKDFDLSFKKALSVIKEKKTFITKSSVEKLADKIQKQSDAVFDKLAAEYRKEVLIPLASKHRLLFMAGMGSASFYSADNSNVLFSDAEEAMAYGYTGFTKVFDVLNVETPRLGQHDCLALHVMDIKKEDWLR